MWPVADVPRLCFDRQDRFSDIGFTGPRVRSWLQAALRHIVNYVRLTSSSGNSDAEFPLLEALRTKAAVWNLTGATLGTEFTNTRARLRVGSDFRRRPEGDIPRKKAAAQTDRRFSEFPVIN